MFRITSSKGFHIEFPNGVTVSVQFGGGNYCDNYDEIEIGREPSLHILESYTAEVAVWIRGGHWITREFYPEDNDDVHGHADTEEVLRLLNWAAQHI